MAVYNLMSYIIPFYDITLLANPYNCIILTPWMSDYQHTPMVHLCFLFSGTKYSNTLHLNLTFFDLFNVLL